MHPVVHRQAPDACPILRVKNKLCFALTSFRISKEPSAAASGVDLLAARTEPTLGPDPVLLLDLMPETSLTTAGLRDTDSSEPSTFISAPQKLMSEAFKRKAEAVSPSLWFRTFTSHVNGLCHNTPATGGCTKHNGLSRSSAGRWHVSLGLTVRHQGQWSTSTLKPNLVVLCH